MRKKQSEIAEYIRDLFRIKAEIIAEHYEPETLAAMTALTNTPEMMQIMRDDKLRGYSVDIESDATIFTDEEEEKRLELNFIIFWCIFTTSYRYSKSITCINTISISSLRFLMGA